MRMSEGQGLLGWAAMECTSRRGQGLRRRKVLRAGRLIAGRLGGVPAARAARRRWHQAGGRGMAIAVPTTVRVVQAARNEA